MKVHEREKEVLGPKTIKERLNKECPCNPLHCHTQVYTCLVQCLCHIIQLLQPKNKLSFIGSCVQPRTKQTNLKSQLTPMVTTNYKMKMEAMSLENTKQNENIIYILLKAEAQRLMLLLSRCATSAATSFSFLKYNLSYNFEMVFTIFNPINPSPINVAHYLFIYFHYIIILFFSNFLYFFKHLLFF